MAASTQPAAEAGDDDDEEGDKGKGSESSPWPWSAAASDPSRWTRNPAGVKAWLKSSSGCVAPQDALSRSDRTPDDATRTPASRARVRRSRAGLCAWSVSKCQCACTSGDTVPAQSSRSAREARRSTAAKAATSSARAHKEPPPLSSPSPPPPPLPPPWAPQPRGPRRDWRPDAVAATQKGAKSSQRARTSPPASGSGWLSCPGPASSAGGLCDSPPPRRRRRCCFCPGSGSGGSSNPRRRAAT